MRAVLNVDGKQYEVNSMDWFEGKVHCVMVTEGYSRKFYYDAKLSESYVEERLAIDMDKCLDWIPNEKTR